MSEVPYEEVVLQDAQSTGDGASVDLQCRNREAVVYVRWSAGTSAGAVTVETASDPAYAGAWASLAVVAWAAADREDVVQVTGALRAVRTRISTAVVGGTVTTKLHAN